MHAAKKRDRAEFTRSATFASGVALVTVDILWKTDR